MTNGWQKSGERQYGTKFVVNRQSKNDAEVLPVIYDNFDDNYDKKSAISTSWVGANCRVFTGIRTLIGRRVF